MKKYSSASTGQGQNQNVIIVLGCAAVVAVLAFTGGEDDPIKQFQSNVFRDRIASLEAQRSADNKLKLLNESAANARKVIEQFGPTGCEVIVNTQTDTVSAGRYHVALSEGMSIIDPVTGRALPEGTCWRDHLGNVAILGPGGIVDSVFYDPELAQNDFTTDTTKTLGGE